MHLLQQRQQSIPKVLGTFSGQFSGQNVHTHHANASPVNGIASFATQGIISKERLFNHGTLFQKLYRTTDITRSVCDYYETFCFIIMYS
jgi:hypothetical protein